MTRAVGDAMLLAPHTTHRLLKCNTAHRRVREGWERMKTTKGSGWIFNEVPTVPRAIHERELIRGKPSRKLISNGLIFLGNFTDY